MTIASGPIGNGPIGSSGGANYVFSVNSGTFTLSMQGAAKLITDIYPSGTFVLSGSPLLNPVALNINAESGTFTYSGSTVVVSLGKGIFLEPIGTFASTGHAVSFQANLSPDAAPGSFTLTGQDQNYQIDISIIPPAATFTTTGQPVTFAFRLDALVGSYAVTFQDAGLSAGRTLLAETAEPYTYQGFDVTFRGWFSPFVPPAIWTEAA